jgi:hypothetical protein
MFPHTLQLSPSLSEDGTARRYDFSWEYRELLEDNLFILDVKLFSDKAHFHLDVLVSLLG